MPLDGVEVNDRFLKSTREKVHGYEYFSRSKYVKEGTAKEVLYNLEKNKRSYFVGDQM